MLTLLVDELNTPLSITLPSFSQPSEYWHEGKMVALVSLRLNSTSNLLFFPPNRIYIINFGGVYSASNDIHLQAISSI